MGFLMRAGLGAAGGYAMTGDWTGAAGGAATAGFAGGMMAKKGAGLFGKRGGIAGLAQKGVGGLRNFGVQSQAGGKVAKSYGAKNWDSLYKMASNRAERAGLRHERILAGRALRSNGVRQEMGTGAQWLGNNATTVNKYGGVALAGLGVAAGAQIGSSAIRSNRGY